VATVVDLTGTIVFVSTMATLVYLFAPNKS
jgi:hypothetical protein